MKVAFLKGNGIYDRLIQIGTWGPYSHCEFVFTNGTWFGTKPYGDFKTTFHGGYTNLTNWDFVPIPTLLNRFEGDVDRMAHKMNNKDYDWKGIFLSQVIPLNMQDDDKYFCSEVVMWLLAETGLLRNSKKLVSPNKVHRLLRAIGI
jgi:hypothetical protein